MINRLKELTGVYGTGFDHSAVMGFLLPILFVLLVGGVGWLINRLFLS